MTEAEWLSCTEPNVLIRFLHDRLSARKARLFAVACCDLIAHQLSEKCREAVRLAELYADGQARAAQLSAYRSPGSSGSAWVDAKSTARRATHQRPAQRHLLHEVIGNPFRPVTIEAAWLTWNTGTVPRLAQVIYEERAFDRLPVIADALEEAGCTDAAILGHCRGPGPHVRGCWVIDLLLGKQ